MTWFKNITAYRLAPSVDIDAASLADALAQLAFQPCGGLSMASSGWIPPVADEALAYSIPGRHLFLTLCTEKRVIPPQTIARVTSERCTEIERTQGFAPGRKQRREIKEDVIDEMLPRAFTTRSATHVWLDTVNGWLVIDSASGARCDEVMRLLLRVEIPGIRHLHTNLNPRNCMSNWLLDEDLPRQFTIDRDAELRANGGGKATVKFINHSLDGGDVTRHISAGKQCTRLAMTWRDRVSFVLTDALTINRIQPLNIINENTPADLDARERIDADLILMTGDLGALLADMVDALGGEYSE